METRTSIITAEQMHAQDGYCQKVRDLWAGRGIVPTAYVETYGCQQNEADSEILRGLLERCGYTICSGAEGADVVIFNTCAIREHAEQRVFGNLGALTHTKRRHPSQKIFVCGCMAGQAHVSERIRKSYPYVDACFNPHHLWQLPEYLWRVLSKKGRIFATEEVPGVIAEGLPQRRDGKIKAWVSIMYGCNNFCAYCIVPYVRGRERSRRPEAVIEECRGLIEAGYKDITLLGQNVNSYGKDLGLGVDFADLLAEIARIPGEFTLRFMTSHPKDASEKLFDTMAKYPNIAHQFHLPVQSGSDRILKAMNRHYDRAQYLHLIEYGRRVMPDIVFTSDIIVGFPGETEEDFEDTLNLCEQVRYDALFTFIYSPRKGTPAAELPDPTPRAEKNERFDRLLDLQNRISEECHRAYLGKTVRVLVDGTDGDNLTGRTDGGRLVRLPGDSALIGQFIPVTITGHTTWSLTGEYAPEQEEAHG